MCFAAGRFPDEAGAGQDPARQVAAAGRPERSGRTGTARDAVDGLGEERSAQVETPRPVDVTMVPH